METKNREAFVSELAKVLLKVDALKLGTYTTQEGKLTSYFIDLKKIASFPDAFSLAYQCLSYSVSSLESSMKFEYFCGIPMSGLLLTSVLGQKHHKPFVYPAKDPTKGVRGVLRPGCRVLVINDVSETGLSIKSAVQAVRSSGGIVDDALTLIDRSEGASRMLEDVNVRLHSFTTIEELASTLRENMAISEEQEQAIETKPE